MILPKTWRLSSRSSPLPNSAIGSSLSITGSTWPDPILASPSRTLRMLAPNEPKMRICCWKSWNRFMSVEMPLVDPPKSGQCRLQLRPNFSFGSPPRSVALENAAWAPSEGRPRAAGPASPQAP